MTPLTKKALLVFLLFVFFFSVSAEPLLNYYLPDEQYYAKDQPINFRIYAIEQDGSFVTDFERTCTLDIFHPKTNAALLKYNLTYDGTYFNQLIPAVSIPMRGEYSYIVLCNTTANVSAVSSSFTVNGNGEVPTLPAIFTYLIPLSLMLGIVVISVVIIRKSEMLLTSMIFASIAYLLGMFLAAGIWLLGDAFFISLTFIPFIFKWFFFGLLALFIPFVIGQIIIYFFSILADERVFAAVMEGDSPESLISSEKNPFIRFTLKRRLLKK